MLFLGMNKFQFMLDRAEYPDFLAWARDHVVPDPLKETSLGDIDRAYMACVGCDDPPWKGYVNKCMRWLGAKQVGRAWHCRIV